MDTFLLSNAIKATQNSPWVMNLLRSLIPLNTACRLAAYTAGMPGCTFKFMDPNDEDEIRQVGDLMADVFLKREPLSHALGTSDTGFPDALRAYSHVLSARCAVGGLTPIAKSADGTVIALVMVEHWDRTKAPCSQSPALQPFCDILERLDVEFANRRGTDARVAEITMGAVHPDFGGQGIMSRLVSLSLLNAFKRGYDECMTKSTSYSRLGLKGAGFEVLAELKYKEYEYKGARPFASIEDPTTVQLMWSDVVSILAGYPGGILRGRQKYDGKLA
ncbi:hypothetical protein V492_03686 [Pseudogymnoascus sp. VKM F-4246]|nr:hypothetical protein V492_03686 [Pseudogymnoascus sp. VKM F-4246]